jgi:hypothetical protein
MTLCDGWSMTKDATLGGIQGTFREHSENIRSETIREHSEEDDPRLGDQRWRTPRWSPAHGHGVSSEENTLNPKPYQAVET